MKKTIFIILSFMIILSIAFGNENLSMKVLSSNKDAYMLSLPTAYIMPKGQMRIQVTYNFNPFQTYFDLHNEFYTYPNSFGYHDYNDLQRKNMCGIILDYALLDFMQLSLSYAQSTWEENLFYDDEYYYNNYSNRIDALGLIFKIRLVKERKVFPQVSIYSNISIFNESIHSSKKESVSSLHYSIYYNLNETRESKSLFDIPLIISKEIGLGSNVNLTLCFSSTISRFIHFDHDNYGGIKFNLFDKFKIGYENRMSYLRYYKSYNYPEEFFRRSSETKYYLIYKINNDFNFQLCYLKHLGSKYLNYKYDKYGFGLSYNFKILMRKEK